MKKILLGALTLLLVGAGCTNAPQPSIQNNDLTANVQSNIEWQMYTDSDPDFDIQFEYPTGYAVTPGGTDSFFGYDIAEQGSNTAKIRIIMTRDSLAAQLFADNIKGDARYGLFERYAKVGQNPLYEPTGEIHVAATGSLDSQGIFTFIIDQQPTDDLTIADHIFETLHVTNKK